MKYIAKILYKVCRSFHLSETENKYINKVFFENMILRNLMKNIKGTRISTQNRSYCRQSTRFQNKKAKLTKNDKITKIVYE